MCPSELSNVCAEKIFWHRSAALPQSSVDNLFDHAFPDDATLTEAHESAIRQFEISHRQSESQLEFVSIRRCDQLINWSTGDRWSSRGLDALLSMKMRKTIINNFLVVKDKL